MRNPIELVLKAFLSRCPPEKKAALTRFLPEKERARLEQLPSFSGEPSTEGHVRVIDQVHWSWFLPTLKAYSPKEQKLFLSAVSPRAARNLGHILNNTPATEITETGKAFLRGLLVSSLIGPEGRLLPIDYLPPSRFKPLLHSSKKELTGRIDLLALHDLSMELRQIVETKTLKKLYSFLTPAEKKRLQQISEHPDSFTLPRMGLERWDGTEESFRLLLHRKGLARLGLGLSGQDPDLIWYICHQLDIGRGNLLFKLSHKEVNAPIVEAIAKQIEEIFP